MVWRGLHAGWRTQFLRLYAIYTFVVLAAFMFWLYLVIPMRPSF
jgi:hypothetical protein